MTTCLVSSMYPGREATNGWRWESNQAPSHSATDPIPATMGLKGGGKCSLWVFGKEWKTFSDYHKIPHYTKLSCRKNVHLMNENSRMGHKRTGLLFGHFFIFMGIWVVCLWSHLWCTFTVFARKAPNMNAFCYSLPDKAPQMKLWWNTH